MIAPSVKRIEGINSVGSSALTAFEKHYVSIPFIKHVLAIPEFLTSECCSHHGSSSATELYLYNRDTMLDLYAPTA